MSEPNIERNRQIDELFRQALELSERERNRFLKEATAHDSTLLEEVEKLLEYHDKSEALFGDTLSDFLAPILPLLEGEDTEYAFTFEEGTFIDHYRVKTLIGRGGMGQVYLAERDDGVFKKDVALKCIKKGMDSEEILKRFSYERQVLARLQHPNIAALYDGGLTESGQPYFVMEYVEGIPIDEYCDRHKLTVDDRLKLFLSVCDAVQYAHQKLVVHRDLKPSNILVTDGGLVKLLDFGIARLLDDDPDNFTAPVTRAGFRLMTPKYAAPEQVNSEPVTTATDVYSLGVLLLELLTGSVSSGRWKQGDSPSVHLMKNQGRSGKAAKEPGPESIAQNRSTTVDKLCRMLSGDLGVILQTALKADPSERYRSAALLMNDIGNYLLNQPISARPESAVYRVQKFVQRHKAGVAAGSLFLILLILFTGITAVQQAQTRTALLVAEFERDTAEEVSLFLESLLAAPNPMASNPDRADTMRVSQLLERAEHRIYSEFEANPEIRSRMLVVLGRSYRGLGDTERATELFESALDIHRTSGIRNDEDKAKALSMLAAAYMDMGNNGEAEELLREAQGLYGNIYSGDHQSVASNLSNIASSLQNQGKFDEARQFYDEALAMMQRMQIPDSLLYANLLNANTALAYRLNDFDAAISLTRESLSINRALLGGTHPRIGRELNNLAFLLDRSGNTEEAIPVYREALGLNQTLLDEGHPFVIGSMGNLAFALSKNGETAEAEELFSRAFELHRSSGAGDNPELSVMLANYALMLTNLTRYEEAEELYRTALEIDRRLFGDSHFRTGIVLGRVGGVLCRLKRSDEGMKYLDDALTVLRNHFQEEHPRLIDIMNARQNCIDPG